jgi:hypothetical protein
LPSGCLSRMSLCAATVFIGAMPTRANGLRCWSRAAAHTAKVENQANPKPTFSQRLNSARCYYPKQSEHVIYQQRLQYLSFATVLPASPGAMPGIT